MRKSLKFEIIRGAAAILVALAVAMVFIFIISDVPFQALYNLIVAPFTRMRYIWIILERMIPIIFTGLATCVMFNANQFNLAAMAPSSSAAGRGRLRHLPASAAPCCTPPPASRPRCSSAG